MAGRHVRVSALVPIAPAASADWPAIQTLLEASGLPTADLAPEAVARFLVARSASGAVRGCVAVEAYGDTGLLRSLAVAPEAEGRGTGSALVDAAVVRAQALGLTRLVLLTDGAAAFFRARGWAPVAREAVPLAVRRSSQFTGGCSGCAACLWRGVPPPGAEAPEAEGAILGRT